MQNYDNQSQFKEYRIYIKDMHQWVPVSKTDFDNYYRDINAYRRRQQEHGRCVCPASKRYLCNMDCCNCRFHKGGDELSLDYTVTSEDGNEKSWLENLPDDRPSAQSVTVCMLTVGQTQLHGVQMRMVSCGVICIHTFGL